MSTRSSMNKRTQDQLRGETKTGMARKSAASAKPARAAASSVRVVPASSKAKRRQAERGEDLSGLSKEERKARKAEIRRREDRIYTVTTILVKEDFEYNQKRKVWKICMGAGIVFVVIAFILLMISSKQSTTSISTLQYVVVALAYVAIIAGFVYDAMKIRPIRNEFQAKAEGMSEGRINEILERNAAAESAAREAKRARKKA